MEKIKVPSKPGRLIRAVANIGYAPEVALCDLVDNCIDANANRIGITLQRDEQGGSDRIESYIIADNGHGMDRDTLVGAFTLGTERVYTPGSLGKFGIGLKSAGLSLGDEITILTQRKGDAPLFARLSMPEVESTGDYLIDFGSIPDEYQELWNSHSLDEQGTVLIIRELTDDTPLYDDFQSYLTRFCSTTYHRFLEGEHPRIEAIRIDGQQLNPFDPLFMAEAVANGPLPADTKWSGKNVHLLLESVDFELGSRIAATHLVHPPSFGDEGRAEARGRYGIDIDPYTRRPRHGFYVYRNDRVIVMAERFHGIIPAGESSRAFRASLSFTESADTALYLDVKKGHLKLPRNVRQNLRATITVLQRQSSKTWEARGGEVKKEKQKGANEKANEGIDKSPVSDLQDQGPDAVDLDLADIEKRKTRQADVALESEKSIHDTTVTHDDLDTRAESGDVVVKVQGLRSNAMWLPRPAVRLGKAQTLVNEQHSWVLEAYDAASRHPTVTVVLNHLFSVLGRAELDVRSRNWPGLTAEQVDRFFDTFRKRVSIIAEDLADQLKDTLVDIGDEPEGGSSVEVDDD